MCRFPAIEIERVRLETILDARRIAGMGSRVELLGNVFDWHHGFGVHLWPAVHEQARRAESLSLGRCVCCHRRRPAVGLKRCQYCLDRYRKPPAPCARCGGDSPALCRYCPPCRPLADRDRRRERAAARQRRHHA